MVQKSRTIQYSTILVVVRISGMILNLKNHFALIMPEAASGTNETPEYPLLDKHRFLWFLMVVLHIQEVVY